MIKILENVYAVNVPSEAHSILIHKALGNSFIIYKIERSPICTKIDENDYELLGTATPTEIDFDVEPLVESKVVFEALRPIYKDYDCNYPMWTKTAEKSFRSALTAARITEYEKLVIIQKVV